MCVAKLCMTKSHHVEKCRRRPKRRDGKGMLQSQRCELTGRCLYHHPCCHTCSRAKGSPRSGKSASSRATAKEVTGDSLPTCLVQEHAGKHDSHQKHVRKKKHSAHINSFPCMFQGVSDNNSNSGACGNDCTVRTDTKLAHKQAREVLPHSLAPFSARTWYQTTQVKRM